MKPRRPPRIPGFNYIGTYAYLLTTCTSGRREWFRKPAIVHVALEQLLRTAEEERFAVTAYCFMPDHAHLLVQGLADDSDLRRFMKVFKQRATFHSRDLRDDDLWQEGYHDHVLRAEDTTEKVTRYILDNPVRAGLVEKAEDYPYSGSSVQKLAEIIEGFC